jgi:hypothetical protein
VAKECVRKQLVVNSGDIGFDKLPRSAAQLVNRRRNLLFADPGFRRYKYRMYGGCDQLNFPQNYIHRRGCGDDVGKRFGMFEPVGTQTFLE